MPADVRLPLAAGVGMLLCGAVSLLHDPIAASVGGGPHGPLDLWIARGFGTAAWLAAGLCLSGLVDAVLWRRVVAAALGRPVPGILRTLASLSIHLAAISCAVAFVFESSVGAFLTALGAGGVVLGLALRGMFEDVFTGVAVNLDRVLRIGDWISLSTRDRKLTGRVREIGWRCTQLETEDGQLLVVPNGMLGREVVTNISRPTEPTRFECEILLDPEAAVERVRRILLGAVRSLQGVEGFVADRPGVVLVGPPTDEGVPYLIRYWILPWNPLSPTTARDRVVSRALDHLAIANVPLGRERQEVVVSRRRPLASHEVSLAGRAELLGRVRLFDGLEEGERRRLAADLRRIDLNAGDVLFRQDDRGDTLFIVAEGAVDVLVAQGEAGGPVRVATLGAGDFLGEMSLLTGDPRRATVRAATACMLYELPRATIAAVVEARPEVTEVLSLTLARRKAALESAGRTDVDAVAVEHGRRTLLQRMLHIFGNGAAL